MSGNIKESKNGDLLKAKSGKKDEFYTQISDIEKELKYYTSYFEGKTVYCNCDDPAESMFFRYFIENFNNLKLKRLITTSYIDSPISNTEVCLYPLIGEDKKITKVPHMYDIRYVPLDTDFSLSNQALVDLLLCFGLNSANKLEGDGSFESPECIKLLDVADIVCTNPPFSLLRSFIPLLVSKGKKFLILGSLNSANTKDIFPLIKHRKIWLGQSIHSGDREFKVPDSYPLEAQRYRVDGRGGKYIRVKGVRWFTNIGNPWVYKGLVLGKKYNPDDYPKYDNVNAIHVEKVIDIPEDYDGMMGVPVSFLDKWDPDQFELVGAMYSTKVDKYNKGYPTIGGKRKYSRILIKKR